MKKYTNALIKETSPYLLQHAHNPVNWQGWNNDSLKEAEEGNKLIIISVGYAACHWCHVMEHESFEDEDVAGIMNSKYLSIKVDREERPDVDQVYMDAAHLLTGRGGWPLNVIALPDGRPIYAGTYFTKEQWIKVLNGVYDFYVNTPEKALEQAMQVASGVAKMNYLPSINTKEFKLESIKKGAADWLNAMDNREGGRAGQMKFPMPGSYLALLRYGVAFNDQRAIDLVRLTLDKMASGGLYDQIGGGFSRYSVDPLWHVPHFEKMLYDNAQLITLYSEAYKYFKDPFYLQIVDETIEFCERELKAAQGGYISSIDADSEGEEGQFYVWTAKEVDDVLGDDAQLFKSFYGITEEGNWEKGKNVLKMSTPIEVLEKEFAVTADEISVNIKKSRSRLFEKRELKERPTLDDKILTSWNALMTIGLTHAYEATTNEKYRQLAIANAEFLIQNLQKGKLLQRSYKDGKAKINAFLDDYSFMISSLIRLYNITFDKLWLDKAEGFLKIILSDYVGKSTYFNFKSSIDQKLFVEKQVLEDNVIPAGNSEVAKNLFFLGTLLDNKKYLNLSKEMILEVEPRIIEHAAFYYNWFDLYGYNSAKFLELAIVGPDHDHKRKELAFQYAPYAIMLGGHHEELSLLKGKLKESKTLIYVCVEKTCKKPVEEVEEDYLKTIYSF